MTVSRVTVSIDMDSKPYSNRELDEKFQDIKASLDRIEEQTKKTNGSVASLKLWRAYVTGAVAVLIIIVLPVLGYLSIITVENTTKISGLGAALKEK